MKILFSFRTERGALLEAEMDASSRSECSEIRRTEASVPSSTKNLDAFLSIPHLDSTNAIAVVSSTSFPLYLISFVK